MHTSTPGSFVDQQHAARLELITAEWQIAADLSFCDVVLWYPRNDSFQAIAQARPVTAQTTLPQDMTGMAPPASIGPVLDRVLTTGQPVTGTTDDIAGPESRPGR